jgi:hypothetical protein
LGSVRLSLSRKIIIYRLTISSRKIHPRTPERLHMIKPLYKVHCRSVKLLTVNAIPSTGVISDTLPKDKRNQAEKDNLLPVPKIPAVYKIPTVILESLNLLAIDRVEQTTVLVVRK